VQLKTPPLLSPQEVDCKQTAKNNYSFEHIKIYYFCIASLLNLKWYVFSGRKNRITELKNLVFTVKKSDI